jgi:hypothetical protein
MGKVVNDGVGDYYHILNVAETIKNKFQDAKVTMFIYHCCNNLPGIVRKPMDAQIEIIFCKREVEHENRRTINNYSQIFPILKSADQIIEVSQKTHISFCEDYKLEKQTKEKYKFIGEYGTTIYENNDIEKSMGLNKSDLGIIIRDKPSTSSLLDLNNDKLKQVLFSTTQPSENDLEAYLKTHEPFVGYLKLGSYYQMAFIYTVIAYFKSSEKQTIDLMLPTVKVEFLNKNFLKEQGIGNIKIIKIDNSQIVQEEVFVFENGKELRLINPYPLDQKEFYTLLSHTNRLVACTGDHSLTEAISFDRLPFYELRDMKLSFQTNLIELAERV